MRIDTDTWHYKLWKKTHTAFYRPVPTNTNLCSYVQRMVLVAPLLALGWVGFRIAGLCMLATYYAVVAPIMLCTGHVPLAPSQVFGVSGQHRTYAGLRIGSVELYPWHAIVLSVLGIGEFQMWHRNPEVATFAHIIVAVSVAVIALCVAIAYAMYRYEVRHRAKPAKPKQPRQPNQTIALARSWWQAKKAGVCPLIEFNDAKRNEETDD